MSQTKKNFFRSTTANQAARRPLPHVMVTVLSGHERRDWLHPYLSAAIMKAAFDPRIGMTYTPIHAIHPVDAARNVAVEENFLPSSAEYLVMFDNDIVPPMNWLDAVLTMPEDCDIAILPYWVWGPKQFTVLCFGRWEDGQMIQPEPGTVKPGWNEGGAGGTGAMIIRRRVFESGKLERPFFKIISDAYRGQVMSEDVYFTGRCTEAGFKVYTNTNYPCSHHRTVDLKEVNLGIVNLLNQYVSTVREKYGDIGIDIDTLTRELHPELIKK